jgi:hypothetical protein
VLVLRRWDLTLNMRVSDVPTGGPQEYDRPIRDFFHEDKFELSDCKSRLKSCKVLEPFFKNPK